jgi:hypothetical protein
MTADKGRVVKAMDKAAGVEYPAKPGAPVACTRCAGLEGEIRKMLPLLELNRGTSAVAKRLRHLVGP